MKDWMKRVFVVLLCVMLVISLVRIHNLKEKLERETGYLRSQIQSLEGRINSIYNEVDEMLEQEASLLAFSEWSIASIDADAETATVDVSILPKEYQAGMTEAFLQVGSQEYPMTMEDGQYQAAVETALFDSCEIDAVILRDSTYTRTEHLGWSIQPRYDMLPDAYANLHGSWSFGPKGKDYNTLSCDGDIQVHVDSKGDRAEIQSMELLEIMDGKVKSRTPIPAAANSEGEYAMEWKKTCEIPFGSRFELVAEAVDQYGLIYRCTVNRWESDKDGQSIDDMDWFGYGAEIYNKDGKLLFSEQH